MASTDCGETYQSLYLKGGTDLATSPDNQSFFTPTASEWRTDSIDLVSYTNETNLQIAFRNIGRYGNVVYLDNINIGNLTSLTENTILEPVVFPNPVKAGDAIAIQLEGQFQAILYDQKGAKIQVYSGKDSLLFPISEEIASGLYMLQIQTPIKIWNQRLVVR
jgi:hypothetical protein